MLILDKCWIIVENLSFFLYFYYFFSSFLLLFTNFEKNVAGFHQILPFTEKNIFLILFFLLFPTIRRSLWFVYDCEVETRSSHIHYALTSINKRLRSTWLFQLLMYYWITFNDHFATSDDYSSPYPFIHLRLHQFH